MAVAILGCTTAIVFAPVYYSFVEMNVGDLASSSRYAERLAKDWNIAAPHFLFPALVIGIHSLFSKLTFLEAAWVAITTIQILTALVLFVHFRPVISLNRPEIEYVLGIALPVLLLLIGPISFLTIAQQNLYAGYFNPNNFHNPTSNMLKPFAITLFFAYTTSIHNGSERPGGGALIFLGCLHVISLLIKPSFSIYFIPTLALINGYIWWRGLKIDFTSLFLVYLLPFVLVASIQYLITYTSFHIGSSQRSISIDPLRVILKSTSAAMILPKGLLSTAFPIAVSLLYYQKAKENAELRVAWLGFAVAAAYAYLLIEDIPGSEQWSAGNFWWSIQIAVFLLFVASMRHFLRQLADWRATGRLMRHEPRFWVCVFLFCCHCVGGLLWYLATLQNSVGDWR